MLVTDRIVCDCPHHEQIKRLISCSSVPGTTAEKFITPAGDDNKSPRDRFQEAMAGYLATDRNNIDVFSIRDVPVENPDFEQEGIDVRFTAHGSPYYRAARLNGHVWVNKDKVRSLSVGIYRYLFTFICTVELSVSFASCVERSERACFLALRFMANFGPMHACRSEEMSHSLGQNTSLPKGQPNNAWP